jgi:hypothetical protein
MMKSTPAGIGVSNFINRFYTTIQRDDEREAISRRIINTRWLRCRNLLYTYRGYNIQCFYKAFEKAVS